MCELVSLGSNSLLAGENTGNFVDPEFGGHIPQRQKWSQISPLRTNSLRILTGNFWEPCRELDLTIRELSARIREAYCGALFGANFLRTCPKITESTFERVEYGFTTERSYHMLWW
jgi:hypothetical protein